VLRFAFSKDGPSIAPSSLPPYSFTCNAVAVWNCKSENCTYLHTVKLALFGLVCHGYIIDLRQPSSNLSSMEEIVSNFSYSTQPLTMKTFTGQRKILAERAIHLLLNYLSKFN
jgi:hypothetical protein